MKIAQSSPGRRIRWIEMGLRAPACFHGSTGHNAPADGLNWPTTLPSTVAEGLDGADFRLSVSRSSSSRVCSRCVLPPSRPAIMPGNVFSPRFQAAANSATIACTTRRSEAGSGGGEACGAAKMRAASSSGGMLALFLTK